MLGDSLIVLDYPGNHFSPMQIHNSLVRNKKQSQAVLIHYGFPCEKNCPDPYQSKWIHVNFQCILTIPSNSLTAPESFPRAIKKRNACHPTKGGRRQNDQSGSPVFSLSLSVNRPVWFVRVLRGPVNVKEAVSEQRTPLPSIQFRANSHRACRYKSWIHFPFKGCKQLIPNA